VNPIRAGFVSLSSGVASGDDEAYLRWHLLDHLPEQYSVPGVRLGQRWRADGDPLVASDALAPVRHAVVYWMTEPLEDTLQAFGALGRELREAGRFGEPATPHLLGAYELDAALAAPSALVSPEALPFRAHRGVLLLVDDGTAPLEALLAVDGVAGAYRLRSSARLGTGADQGERFGVPMWDPGDRAVSIVYLDGDVAATTARLAPLVAGRPALELALPLRSMVAYEVWPA
jgi:hypothetical protein